MATLRRTVVVVLAAALAVPGLAGCGLRDRAGAGTGTATPSAAVESSADGGQAAGEDGADSADDAGAAGGVASGGTPQAEGGVAADEVEALEDALADATGTLQDLEDELAQDR